MRSISLEKSNLTWLIVAAIAGAIFFISSLQLGQAAGGISLMSILYHFLIFFWLAFFLAIASVKGKEIKFIIPALLAALIYAVSDEFHQLFVPFRFCSFEDFLIDSAGIYAGIFLYLLTMLIRKMLSRNLQNFSYNRAEYY